MGYPQDINFILGDRGNPWDVHNVPRHGRIFQGYTVYPGMAMGCGYSGDIVCCDGEYAGFLRQAPQKIAFIFMQMSMDHNHMKLQTYFHQNLFIIKRDITLLNNNITDAEYVALKY